MGMVITVNIKKKYSLLSYSSEDFHIFQGSRGGPNPRVSQSPCL